jgi:predicted RNA binding protein YcfA (HicA-like mRNA interferase family)
MPRKSYDPKRPEIAFAINLGWHYCGTAGSGHLQFKHPKANFKLTIASSPSEFRSSRNSISWIRRNTPREDTE